VRTTIAKPVFFAYSIVSEVYLGEISSILEKSKEARMFWIGLAVGFFVGGNFGVFLMALFKMKK